MHEKTYGQIIHMLYGVKRHERSTKMEYMLPTDDYNKLLNNLLDVGYSGLTCEDMEVAMDEVLREFGIKPKETIERKVVKPEDSGLWF